MASAAVDWERLDKQRFFVYGAGIFTGLTATLFPLTVIKTRMMAMEGAPRGLSGAVATARSVVHHDGVRGLYKGFGTVLCGLIPARILYLGSLESSKSVVLSALQHYPISDTAAAGAASFVAGGMASLAGQLVVVPIDVVSQRLMLMGGGPASGVIARPGSRSSSLGGSAAATAQQQVSGLHLVRQILQQEGVRGLYRGFGASVATLVPSSAIWWASYGAFQTAMWRQLDSLPGRPRGVNGARPMRRREGELLGVQVVSGMLTGCTSATLTCPLDVVKTRLQTQQRHNGQGPRPTWVGVVRQLAREEGAGGFFRGLAPRMVSTAIWGTAMVTTYEFLKRLCVLPSPADSLMSGKAGAAAARDQEDAIFGTVPLARKAMTPPVCCDDSRI